MIQLIESIDEFFQRQMICQNGPHCDVPWCPEHNQDFDPNQPETWPVTDNAKF